MIFGMFFYKNIWLQTSRLNSKILTEVIILCPHGSCSLSSFFREIAVFLRTETRTLISHSYRSSDQAVSLVLTSSSPAPMHLVFPVMLSLSLSPVRYGRAMQQAQKPEGSERKSQTLLLTNFVTLNKRVNFSQAPFPNL